MKTIYFIIALFLANISIIDITGETVIQMNTKTYNSNINVSALKQGAYFVRLQTVNGIETKKNNYKSLVLNSK